MRIMTWNIHGASLGDRNERFPRIKQAIEKYRPDIACFQEAFFPTSREMLESIEGYYVAYETNWYPFPRFAESTKGGLVTLINKERLVPFDETKLVEINYNPYLTQGTWFTEQRWDRLIGKGFLETVIQDKEFGKITIINTHKVCTYTKNIDKYLEAQAEQLLGRIRKHKEKGELIILAGDMNFSPQSKLYPAFRELLHEATEGLQPALENLRKMNLLGYETIDYIFTGNKSHWQAQYVSHESWPSEAKYPSDHPGICADVKPDNQ